MERFSTDDLPEPGDGFLLELPDESFRASGTLVRTIVAVIPGSGVALCTP